MSAVTDSVADYLARIRNAQQSGHRHVDIPASKLKRAMTQILVEKGYVNKGQHDRRTNFYQISDAGIEAIQARREWEDQYVPLEL